jgi:predicted PurR-regulated permease PerM
MATDTVDSTPRSRDRGALRVIAVIAVAIGIALASSFLVPLTLGLVLAMLLHPLTVGMRRIRIPQALAAGLSVIIAIAALVLAVTLLVPPVRGLAAELPKTLVAARQRLESLGVRLPGGVSSGNGTPKSAGTTQRGAGASDSAGGGAAASRAGEAKPRDTPQRSAAADSSTQRENQGQSGPTSVGQALTRAFGVTATTLFGLVEILLLAFFILAAGDAWREKLYRSTRSRDRAQRAVDTVAEIKSVALRYMLVNVIINAAQGALVAVVVWLLGYPAPILWGVLTFIAEFIPFFGGAAMVGLLLLTGLAQGGGLAHAIGAPVAYLIITTLQNNLVSPAAYGRGLRLNPTGILIGVMFWGLVWGIAGVFLAVPLLAAMRIIAEGNESLTPLAEFLAD